MKPAFVVTDRVVSELREVRILVTGLTRGRHRGVASGLSRAGRELRRLFGVATHAVDERVTAYQLEHGAAVRETGRGKLRRADVVTRLAGGAELSEVDVVVAGPALHRRCRRREGNECAAAPDGAQSSRGHVASHAGHLCVKPPVELRLFRVDERLHVERRGAMTRLARGTVLPLVRIRVAAHARRLRAAEVDVLLRQRRP